MVNYQGWRSRDQYRVSGLILLGLGAVVAAAASIAVGAGVLVALAAALCACAGLAAVNWRWSVYGLLLFIPLTGLASVALYPQTQIAALLKDIFFVIPCYVGFFLAISPHRLMIRVPGPVGLLALFSGVVLVESLNPSGLGPLASLIGIKVWLLYVPMYWLGYHLLRSEADVGRFLAVLVCAAIGPALIGVAEAMLFVVGQADIVYSFYGPAAASMSQGFAQFPVGGLVIRRVPSTFSFVTQYYFFCAAAIAFAYAALRRARGRRSRIAYAVALALFITAGLTSGQRGAFIFVPLLIGLIVTLDGRRSVVTSLLLAALAAVLVLVIPGVLETTTGAGETALSIGFDELSNTVFSGLAQGWQTALGGLGTGYDTGAARYALAQVAGVEGWFAKAMIELGILGLAALVVLLLHFGTFLSRVHARTTGTTLHPVTAALLALLVWNVLYSLKGQQIDVDPMNVYFWLLAGVIASAPRLQARNASS